jgi:hypothetical protein
MGGRVAVGQLAFLTCYRTATTRHHRISSYPLGPDRVESQLFLFLKRLNVSHIVTPLTYHLVHVKAKCQGAASTPPPSSLPIPPPPPVINIIISIISGWAQTFVLFPPSFYPSLNSQEIVVLAAMLAESKFAWVSSLFKKDRRC